jgi:hypothetical protein
VDVVAVVLEVVGAAVLVPNRFLVAVVVVVVTVGMSGGMPGREVDAELLGRDDDDSEPLMPAGVTAAAASFIMPHIWFMAPPTSFMAPLDAAADSPDTVGILGSWLTTFCCALMSVFGRLAACCATGSILLTEKLMEPLAMFTGR